MFENLFEKKYKNLAKQTQKDFDAECGVCLLLKNSGEFSALAFNKAKADKNAPEIESTLAFSGNLKELSEKAFNDKLVSLLEVAFELKDKPTTSVSKKNLELFEFGKKEYKAYINEYKKNLENGWHIVSVKFIPHHEEYDKYLSNQKSIIRYGLYNKYRVSDKFLVCEVRPLSATCNKLLAYPRDNEIFDPKTVENSAVYSKIKEISSRPTVENVYFLGNNYKDVDLEKYTPRYFEEQRENLGYFHISGNLYIRENGDFVAYTYPNNRQSSLINYIKGNFNETSDEDLAKIITKMWIDGLSENDFLEDMQIDRKDNIVADYECADHKKDKCKGTKWFTLHISKNHPGKVDIVSMKKISGTEWGGGSRNAVLMDIDTPILEVCKKLRYLFDYKKGLLLTKTDIVGDIFDNHELRHFALKEILERQDLEYLTSSGLSAIGFDMCKEGDEICTYPFICKGQGKMYLSRRHACKKTRENDDGLFTIVDFALNDGIYNDKKQFEIVSELTSSDKLEVKLSNLEDDNKYHITAFENGQRKGTKTIARTKILKVLSAVQDHFKEKKLETEKAGETADKSEQER